MTPEQLLQTRYEVIAPYPLMPYNVGDLLHRKNSNSTLYEIISFSDVVYFDEEDIANHPHLFRKLEWWEKRKPEDMPEYVIKPITKQVFKVDKYDLETNTIYVDGGCPFTYTSFIQTKLPCTVKDYTDYVTKNNQQ